MLFEESQTKVEPKKEKKEGEESEEEDEETKEKRKRNEEAKAQVAVIQSELFHTFIRLSQHVSEQIS